MVLDRTGRPRPGIDVRLQRRYKAVGLVDEAACRTDEQGRFSFRGIAPGRIRLRAQAEDWIESYGLGFRAEAGRTDLRLRVKPRSEGWGITVPIDVVDAQGKAIVERLFVQYRLDGETSQWFQHRPEGTDRPGHWILRYLDVPGIVTFTFRVEGYRPLELDPVEISDRGEMAALRLRFDRGAVLRIRVLRPEGPPFADTEIRALGRRVVTDSDGIAELGGLVPRTLPILVALASDPYTRASFDEVAVPGRIDAVLERTGELRVEREGGIRGFCSLLDEEGVVRDRRQGKGGAVLLRSTCSGRHRLVIDATADPVEREVEIVLGRTTMMVLD